MIKVLVLVVAAGAVQAQEPLTLNRAVELALKNYPALRVTDEQVNAAAGAIDIARLAYLPRIEGIAQVNRATANNVYGMLLPQAVIPGISGPPVADPRAASIWGTAVGVLFSWEPFDFGLRKAAVAAAEAGRRRSDLARARSRFEIAAMTADAYLTLLAAEQTRRAAQAGVDRAEALERVVKALVDSELRPGVDLARIQFERAAADAQVIRAAEAFALGRATIAQLTGLSEVNAAAERDPLASRTPPLPEQASFDNHPAVAEQRAAIDAIQAREETLNRAWYPRFETQGAAYGRGTGGQADGSLKGGAHGLAPNFGNWGVGLSVTFPVLEYRSIRAQRQVESANERAERARLDQVMRDLEAERAKALARMEAAQRLAGTATRQRTAAQQAERAARSRYEAGLSSIVELTEASRLQTQAEIEENVARLNLWRAYLGIATAQGDLRPFLTAAGGN